MKKVVYTVLDFSDFCLKQRSSQANSSRENGLKIQFFALIPNL